MTSPTHWATRMGKLFVSSRDARPWSALGRHRTLVWQLAKRDVLGRYRGSSLGVLWSLAGPLLMLLVYVLAFGSIMRARWPGAEESNSAFALIIFTGLIVHGFFSECLIRSPQLVASNTSYVKKIIFPIEILPWSMVFSALFHVGANMLILIVFFAIINGYVPWTVIFTPVVLLPFAILMIGMSWIVSALSVYFRDLNQIVSPLATAMLFLSSAIVPLDSVPGSFRFLFEMNPLTFIIDQLRSIMLWSAPPDSIGLAIYTCLSLAVFLLGFSFFQTVRRGFADVL